LNDIDFVNVYFEKYKGTVQHELAEVIDHVERFATAHGVDIYTYLNQLHRFRKIMKEGSKPVVSESVTKKVIVTPAGIITV
jgi:hypothetical protein